MAKKPTIAFLNFPKKLSNAGYDQTLLTSICYKSIKDQLEFDTKLEILKPYHDALIKLLNPLNKNIKFTPSNISSILRYSEDNFDKAIQGLVSNFKKLKILSAPVSSGGMGLSPKNITSIITSKGDYVGQAIEALCENYHKLQDLTTIGFSAINISSILHCSGRNVGDIIDALAPKIDVLKKLMAPIEQGGIGFSPVNISSILSGTGKKIGEVIDILDSKFDILRKLVTSVEEGGIGLKTNRVSSILHSSGKNISEIINSISSIFLYNQTSPDPIETEALTTFLVDIKKKSLIRPDVVKLHNEIKEKLNPGKLSNTDSKSRASASIEDTPLDDLTGFSEIDFDKFFDEKKDEAESHLQKPDSKPPQTEPHIQESKAKSSRKSKTKSSQVETAKSSQTETAKSSKAESPQTLSFASAILLNFKEEEPATSIRKRKEMVDRTAFPLRKKKSLDEMEK